MPKTSLIPKMINLMSALVVFFLHFNFFDKSYILQIELQK